MALLSLSARCLVAAILAAAASATQAQVEWSRLSPQQQGVLAPLSRDWARVDPSQQQKWIEVANRYRSLPPQEQARAQQRMTEWSRLSPQDRARARLNFQEARQVGPEERQQQWEAYRALPPEQRRALADRARADAAQRPAPRASTERPSSEKSSVVRAPQSLPPRPVGPTVVQRGAGATTDLVSRRAAPPLHQQAGLPKVAATPGFVDSATLLPQRGAQGVDAAAPRRVERKNGKPNKSQ
jgi:Protein of unknown function (DUF3106)